MTERYKRLADSFYDENRGLVIRRAGIGSLLALVGTAGYYGAYVVILYRTLHGMLTIGSLTFLAGSFARSRSLIEGILGNLSSISEQAMYVDDLFAFLRMEPRIHSMPNAFRRRGRPRGWSSATSAPLSRRGARIGPARR